MQLHGCCTLAACEADHAHAPINAVRREAGDIGLTTADVPERGVIGSPLGVALIGHDFRELIGGDAALVLEADLWPLPTRDEWAGSQPKSRAAFCRRRRKMFVHTAPALRTAIKCSG